jgi:predicted metal-dependent hydrolase
MTTLSAILQVDDLRFEVRRSSRRRSLEITVDRGGELVLAAPPEVGEERLREFVREKRFWIYTKLAAKEQLQKTVSPKEFVNGEGFLYLGRSYRLLLVDGQDPPVKLQSGRFTLRRDLADEGREHLVRWYGERGRIWLWHKAREYANRMEAKPAGVKVRDLGYRWGSCGKGDWLYFHWKAILLPPRIAEYVVVHELAHLHEPHHTPEFWRRVERALPDYERRKTWLAEQGMNVEGL